MAVLYKGACPVNRPLVMALVSYGSAGRCLLRPV